MVESPQCFVHEIHTDERWVQGTHIRMDVTKDGPLQRSGIIAASIEHGRVNLSQHIKIRTEPNKPGNRSSEGGKNRTYLVTNDLNTLVSPDPLFHVLPQGWHDSAEFIPTLDIITGTDAVGEL